MLLPIPKSRLLTISTRLTRLTPLTCVPMRVWKAKTACTRVCSTLICSTCTTTIPTSSTSTLPKFTAGSTGSLFAWSSSQTVTTTKNTIKSIKIKLKLMIKMNKNINKNKTRIIGKYKIQRNQWKQRRKMPIVIWILPTTQGNRTHTKPICRMGTFTYTMIETNIGNTTMTFQTNSSDS